MWDVNDEFDLFRDYERYVEATQEGDIVLSFQQYKEALGYE